MILKYWTDSEFWKVIDKIKNISFQPASDTTEIRTIFYEKENEPNMFEMTLSPKNDAYILNDGGKTIERIN